MTPEGARRRHCPGLQRQRRQRRQRLGGGRLGINAGSSATVSRNSIRYNLASGSPGGSGGVRGQGLGGGVHDDGAFTAMLTAILDNHATTSHDNVYP